MADAKGAITWDLSVDSTVCRAHQRAAGARTRGDLQKEPPGGVFAEPGGHGLGRSRGGFTTKLHLAVEQGQKPMSIVVTAGQRGDSPQFEPVLEKVRVPRTGLGRPRVRPDRLRADKAHAPARTAPTCAVVGSAAPSPTRPTSHGTARSSAPAAADRHASIRPTSASVTRSSANQPPQEASRGCHALRQTGGPLRGDRPHLGHQRGAVIGTRR